MDREFLLDGILHGFKIVNSSCPLKPASMNNYKSALSNHHLVEKQIRIELAEKRYVVVEKPPLLISAIGAIEKSDGGVRIIHDCSQPKGLGLNDYVAEKLSVKYQSVQEAAQLLAPQDYMVKIDLKAAYRSVALHPSQWQYTGLKWTFKGESEPTYMIDTSLPFGAALSPGIFNRLTQAVRRMLEKRGIKSVVYLDDFWICASNLDTCKEAQQITLSLLRKLGFSIAWHKVEGPVQQLTFLGIEMDSCEMTLSLPQNKVAAYKLLLADFEHRSRASGRQLQQLAGKLAWASTVVAGGRIYLQRVLNTLRPLKHAHHKVLLDNEFREDIKWWLLFMEQFNCKRIILKTRPEVCVFTDASQSGAGMVCESDWGYIDWQLDLPHMVTKHINVKEGAAVAGAVYRWAPSWTGCDVTIYTDNITTRAAFNKGNSHDATVMAHVRDVFWLSQVYDFKIKCVHIPGVTNFEADTVSRLRQRSHLQYWCSVLAKGAPYTETELSRWLLAHCSVATASSIFAQRHRALPWLQTWTEQLLI